MIRFCILDHDTRYAEALVNFLSVRYGSQVEPCLFHSLDALRDYLKDHRPDLVLASAELLAKPELLPSQAVAYLSEDRDIERFNGRPVVFRYQRGESLLRQIKGIAAEADKRNAVYTAGERGEAWLFLGAGGGTGCSTAAVGCAAQLARTGRKVLYMNLQSLGDVSGMLSGEGTGGMTRVLYEVKTFLGNREGQGNLAPRLEGLVRYDSQLQVHYYGAFDMPMEAASLTGEEMACLLTTLTGVYEVVVADMDGVYSPALKAALGQAAKIVPVSSGTETANRKLKKLLDMFAVLDESEDLRTLPRTRVLYSRFGSAARQAEECRAPVLGVIQHYTGADTARIVRELRGKELFLSLPGT